MILGAASEDVAVAFVEYEFPTDHASQSLRTRLQDVGCVSALECDGRRLRVTTRDLRTLSPILQQVASDLGPSSVRFLEPSLETAFLALTGRALRD